MITSLILVSNLPVYAFWPFTTRSDLVSYYAPCWGQDNKIFFVKQVTFGQAVYPYFFNGPIFLGNYLADHTEVYLCSMNYDGTDKKEIAKLGDTRNKTYWLPMYLDYCQANNLLLLSGGSIPSGGTSHGIYTIRPDGREMRKVLDEGMHASWSPDGKRMVYEVFEQRIEGSRRDEFFDIIWMMDVDGKNKRMLSYESEREWQGSWKSPIWSPKDDLIAFVCHGWIWVMKPDGRERRRVIKEMYLADWTPDGNKLILARSIVDLEGNLIKELSGCGHVSPNGKMILGEYFSVWNIEGEEKTKDLFADITRKDKYFVYKKPDNIW
ncbi:MAG: hypothetical protein ABIF11_03640 [Nitrospirota bacterium]